MLPPLRGSLERAPDRGGLGRALLDERVPVAKGRGHRSDLGTATEQRSLGVGVGVGARPARHDARLEGPPPG